MLANSEKVVGSKQVSRGISEGTIGCVIVAEDTERAMKERIVAAAEKSGVSVLYAPDMAWLGAAAGIDVGAAVAGIKARED